MIHWYLKSMRVRPALRHTFQQVKTRKGFDEAIERVRAENHRRHDTGDIRVPVPSGPNAHW